MYAFTEIDLSFTMQVKHLLPLFASAVQATNLLLPLYVYPSYLGTWNYIYKVIADHPDLDFDIIINPSDGPGGERGVGYNSDYIQGVAQLNAYHNVHLFGYVHTSYGSRSIDDVNQDTAYWADWSSYTAEDISVEGIFFDEVPNNDDQGNQDVEYMTEVTDYAYSLFDKLTHEMQTIYNVGMKSVHPEYFDDEMADYVIVFENYAYKYSPDVLRNNVPTGAEAKSSILLHGFFDPACPTLPDSTVKEWLRDFNKAGLGSANILDRGYEYVDDKSQVAQALPADLASVAEVLA